MTAGTLNLNDFISLSEFLLGIPFPPPLPPITSLDPALAQTYLNGTQSNPGLATQNPNMGLLLSTWHTIQMQPSSQWPALVQSQIFGNPALQLAAQQTILAWYIDFHIENQNFQNPDSTLNPQPEAGLYEKTLVWSLAQAHPMGVPLSFGYWQYPPSD
jgi:hypothetical protein